MKQFSTIVSLGNKFSELFNRELVEYENEESEL